MSVVATTERGRASADAVSSRDRRPGMARLTAVELRKMFDTRSGFWLPICVAVVAIATAVISVFAGAESNRTFAHEFGNALMPTAVLLPLIGVLLVTGEFSQRTALTTFTLVPSRARVMVAKLSASVACAVVAVAFCLLVGAFATALHPAPGAGVWALPVALIPQALLYLAATMITGVAFGAALLASAPAIVVYLLLPTVWSVLASSISALQGVANWLDTSMTLDPLARHALSATDWAQAGTTLALWLALPLAIGWWRVMRRDVG